MTATTRSISRGLTRRTTRPSRADLVSLASALVVIVVVSLGLLAMASLGDETYGTWREPMPAEGPPASLEHMAERHITGAGTALLADGSRTTGASRGGQISDQEETS